MIKQSRVEMRQRDLSTWPHYDAAALGFRNYWYPVTWSRRIGRRPVAVQLLGDRIMFRREQGKVYALYDQCLHRGIPLSVGRQEFPGTWSCRYHGWTYELHTGILRAALTDGPESAICNKVAVKTYPVEERAGLVFVWLGDGPPVPVEEDLPEDLIEPNTLVVGRITVRKGDWRYATENGYDEAHSHYLHRYGALMMLFSRNPGWIVSRNGGTMNGPWMSRTADEVGVVGDFPGLGRWPKFRFWHRLRGGPRVAVRLPCSLRVAYPKYTHYTWYEPVDTDHHRYFQLMVVHGSWLRRAMFWLTYWLYRRWIFHVQFNNQDAWMVELMPETGPERLFRPDASITAWRRLCEQARGENDAEALLERGGHVAEGGAESAEIGAIAHA